MDKLGTYALVAALKGISQKASPDKGADPVNGNERWISLRSCMTELENVSLDPPPPPQQQPEPAVMQAAVPPIAHTPLTTARPQRSYSHLQAISQRHREVGQKVR